MTDWALIQGNLCEDFCGLVDVFLNVLLYGK